jgi:hypothetical protein
MKNPRFRAFYVFAIGVVAIFTLSACDDAAELLDPAASQGRARENRAADEDVLLGWSPRVGGDWRLDTNTVGDTCGVGGGTPARVFVIAQRGDSLDVVPVDSAGGCGAFAVELATARVVSRDWTATVAEGDGPDACTVDVATSFRLDFQRDTFTAREDNVLTYVSGDCGEFTTSCEWSLQASGTKCEACVPECAVAEDRVRLGGPLGWPVEVTLSSLQNAP